MMVKPGTTRSGGGTRSAVGSGGGKYKGVRMRKWGKWVAEVRQPNSRDRIWLGSYDSAGEAARAYDAAVFCLRGPTAVLNFPESPPEIPAASDLSPPQIQEAAVRHARGSAAAEAAAGPDELWVAPPIDGGGGSFRDRRYNYLPSVPAAESRGEDESRMTGGVFYHLPRVWSF